MVRTPHDFIARPSKIAEMYGVLTGSKYLKIQLFNFWASYKVVYSESFNFYSLGFWASKCKGSHPAAWLDRPFRELGS